MNKFRQNESFMFSWKEPIETGDGRSTVWLSPNIGLRFPEPEPERDAATDLPGATGSHVDWATDRPEPPTSRAARLPRR